MSLISVTPLSPNTETDGVAAKEQSRDLDFASQMLPFDSLKRKQMTQQ